MSETEKVDRDMSEAEVAEMYKKNAPDPNKGAFEEFLQNFVPTYADDADFKPQSKSRQDLLRNGARNWASDNLRDNGKGEDPPHTGLMYFEGAEHERIAEGVKLWDIHGKCSRDAMKHIVWNIAPGGKPFPLKFGRIIALAGDHYSTHDVDRPKPQRAGVSGFHYYSDTSFAACKARFRTAVESLQYDLDGYFPAIAALMDKECNTMDNIINEGKRPETTMKEAYHLHSCGLPSDRSFFVALMKGGSSGAGKFISLYAWFAYVNFDHFGEDAEISYMAGHTLAIELAREAAKAATDEEKSRMLNRAYLYEAFAAHYLTDLFSTGHSRAPRRKFHTISQWNTLAANAKSQIPGNKECPIWDYHNRYMHDDDSATGLLVRNRNGEQWIAHGDKQYLEPGNIVNRARVTLCIQASVDEMYDLGFRNPTAQLPKVYAASKLHPEPMLAHRNPNGFIKGWGGYDQHNPANLWQAESNEEPETKYWSYRSNPNDHSIFSRKSGSVDCTWRVWGGITPTPEAELIRDAAFRGEGQFVRSEAIPRLDTGGVIQIQDHKIDGKRRRCANVWSPALVNFREDDHDCYTLRNRLIDFDTGSNFVDKDSLHWTSQSTGDRTDLYHFYGEDGIKVATYTFKDPRFEEGKQSVTFDKDKAWTMSYAGGKAGTKISSALSFGGAQFLVSNFTAESSPEQPDIAVLSFSEDAKAQVTIGTYRDGAFSKIYSTNTALKPKSVNFFKSIRTSEDGPRQAILASVAKPDKFEINISAFNVAKDGDIKSFTTQFADDGTLSYVSLLGGMPNQVLALSHTHAKLDNIAIIDVAKQSTNIHACKLPSVNYTYVGPLFSGTFPSLSATETPATTVDVVTVDSYKTKVSGKDKYRLVFRTHIGNQDASTSAKDPFKGCGVVDNIDDKLAEYAKDGAYHSIKWMRCKLTDDPSAHCLMQLFSLFGVLGVRFFSTQASSNGPTLRAWQWQLAGLVPYLGQTSFAAGVGSHADWGHGFVGWGAGIAEDLVDSNPWIYESGDQRWGFTVQDAKRRIVPGSDEGLRKKQAT